MIRVFLALAAVVALVLMVYDKQTDDPVQANNQQLETGWDGLDSVIADNMGSDTQSTIATTTRESAHTVRGISSGVLTEFTNAIHLR